MLTATLSPMLTATLSPELSRERLVNGRGFSRYFGCNASSPRSAAADPPFVPGP